MSGITFNNKNEYNAFALQNTLYWFISEVNGGYQVSRRNLYKDLKLVFPEMPKRNKIKAIQWLIDVGVLEYNEDDTISVPSGSTCLNIIEEYNKREK